MNTPSAIEIKGKATPHAMIDRIKHDYAVMRSALALELDRLAVTIFSPNVNEKTRIPDNKVKKAWIRSFVTLYSCLKNIS
jgi:hypothetical protein